MHIPLLKRLASARRFLRTQLRPLTDQADGFGISEHHLTAVSLMLAVGSGLCIALFAETRWTLLLIPFTLCCQTVLNIARAQIRPGETDRDRLLRILCESGGEAALYLPLAAVDGVCPWLMTTAVVLAVFVEFTGVGTALVSSHCRQDGPLRRPERTLLFASLATLLGLGAPTGRWLDVVLTFVNLLLAATIMTRFRRATC